MSSADFVAGQRARVLVVGLQVLGGRGVGRGVDREPRLRRGAPGHPADRSAMSGGALSRSPTAAAESLASRWSQPRKARAPMTLSMAPSWTKRRGGARGARRGSGWFALPARGRRVRRSQHAALFAAAGERSQVSGTRADLRLAAGGNRRSRMKVQRTHPAICQKPVEAPLEDANHGRAWRTLPASGRAWPGLRCDRRERARPGLYRFLVPDALSRD